MQALRITSKAGAPSHYHVVFTDEESQQGYVAIAGKGKREHTHEIAYIPPELDEQGNPMSEGQWMVLPAEDGHTHENLENYPAPKNKKVKDEDQLLADIMSLYTEAREIESGSKKKAEKSWAFYKGEQWSNRAKAQLRSLDRACLTINHVGKAIDTLIGLQVQERTEFEYTPFEESDQLQCDLFNIVAKHIKEQCSYNREKTKVFKDQAITGRGNYHLFVDFDDSLHGNIKIERFPWSDVHYGPHEKEDLSDCEYSFKERMYSKSKMQQLWPDKADDIQQDFNYYMDVKQEGHIRYHGQQYFHSDNKKFVVPNILGSHVMVDVQKKEYRVLECTQKMYETKQILVHVDSAFVFDAADWKPADINAAMEIPGFYSFKRTFTRRRITRCAGNVILSDENPADVPGNMYFTIPAYAYKDGNDYWGKVEQAKDPQREVNKRHSQAADVINKMAAYNWFIDDMTFGGNKAEERKFLNTSSSPGATFKVSTTDRLPVKEEGVKFPGEIVQLLELGLNAVEDIMNVVVEPSGANESGSHLLHRQKQAMAANEFLFDNLAFAEKQVGKLLLHLIQKYWSPERVYRLVAYQNTREPVSLSGEPFENFTEEEIIAALENVDASQFDVVIQESESSPTRQMQNYILLQELQQGGNPVPPAILIENMPGASDATKRKILDYIAQEQEMAAQDTQAEGETEVVKTLIAQGQIPPHIAEQYGVSQTPPGMGNDFVTDTNAVSPSMEDVTFDVTEKPDGSGKVVRMIKAPQQQLPEEIPEAEVA